MAEHRADVNCKDKYGKTPLHEAAYYGKLEVVKYLVEHGSDVNCKDKADKTPLVLAIEKNEWDSAEKCKKKAEVAAYLEAHGAKE